MEFLNVPIRLTWPRGGGGVSFIFAVCGRAQPTVGSSPTPFPTPPTQMVVLSCNRLGKHWGTSQEAAVLMASASAPAWISVLNGLFVGGARQIKASFWSGHLPQQFLKPLF